MARAEIADGAVSRQDVAGRRLDQIAIGPECFDLFVGRHPHPPFPRTRVAPVAGRRHHSGPIARDRESRRIPANGLRARRLIALLTVAGAPAVLMIWYRMHQSTGFASIELIVYPLVFGGLGILVIWLLKHFFLGEHLSALNSGDVAPSPISREVSCLR